ncbi:hypothetical protein [Miltoncostaea marina]|uniref:hypothetical protein n=1 Tax=Miltoncostaea marina TaxID=2843215 RepID=UPI001C3CF56E|nr:hypothetical protein [Miltoncostaea marina]
MRRFVAIATAAVAAGGAGAGVAWAAGAGDRPSAAPEPAIAEIAPKARTVPHAKFVIAVEGWRAARREVRSLRATLARHPDFRVSLQLAAIAHGQDWRALRRCALTEGYRTAERRARHNTRPNTAGSGAYSSFQFMRGTFLSTPYAGLDWSRQDVQAHAAAWMWAQGRRGEWTGTGC